MPVMSFERMAQAKVILSPVAKKPIRFLQPLPVDSPSHKDVPDRHFFSSFEEPADDQVCAVRDGKDDFDDFDDVFVDPRYNDASSKQERLEWEKEDRIFEALQGQIPWSCDYCGKRSGCAC